MEEKGLVFCSNLHKVCSSVSECKSYLGLCDLFVSPNYFSSDGYERYLDDRSRIYIALYNSDLVSVCNILLELFSPKTELDWVWYHTVLRSVKSAIVNIKNFGCEDERHLVAQRA